MSVSRPAVHNALIASFYEEKILSETPLLKCRLIVSHVYQIIEYEPSLCGMSFTDTISDARRKGDIHPDKAIIVDTITLVGNSVYGKSATDK